MRTFARALLFAGCALGAGRPALAAEPLNLEIAAKVGAGTNPVGGGLPNPMGIATGARAGVSMDGIYAGISAMYYFGQSGQLAVDVLPDLVRAKITPHSFLYGCELGYGVTIARFLVVRAQLGVGDDLLGADGTVTEGSLYDNITAMPRSVRSAHYVYFEPALTVLANFGKVFVGADVGALLLPSGPVVVAPGGGPFTITTAPFSDAQALEGAATVHAQFGVRL